MPNITNEILNDNDKLFDFIFKIRGQTEQNTIDIKNDQNQYGIEFDQDERLINAINVDMFEMAFINKFDFKKQFLISINAKECLICCAYDKKGDLAGIIHLVPKMSYNIITKKLSLE